MLQLLKFVSLATGTELLKRTAKVHIKYEKGEEDARYNAKRLKVKEDDKGNTHVLVYSRSVTVEEVVPLIIQKKICAK